MKSLTVYPIATRIFKRQENLAQFVVEAIPKESVREGLILAVTSKIVSLAEDRLIKPDGLSKKELVQREADIYMGEIGHGCFLTIKSGLLIPSAGIDESNSVSGDYILYPKDPFASAIQLWNDLRRAWSLKDLGILMTDSHTTPLRRGVTGICVSYAGFRAVRSLVGTKDLFGRPLRMTQMNFADGLAAAAVLMMGEGAECQPIALIENAGVEFCEAVDPSELEIPLEEDLYYPLIRAFRDR